MTTAESLMRLGLALAIGLLFGIERGWQEREGKPGSRAAGIRTHALIGLLGGLWGLLALRLGGIVLGLGAIGFAATFAYFEWREMREQQSNSATGLVAGLLAFALGAYAILGDELTASSAAVAATVILAERHALHDFLERLTWNELRAALLLLVMTVILLPVMPDRAVDPWGVINPFQIWLMAVLIASISYMGYVAIRIGGTRNGLLFAGAVGGLISSTTVTWTFARLAKQNAGANAEFCSGILASWGISFVRVNAVAAILSPSLGLLLLPVLGAGSIVLFVSSGVAVFMARKTPTQADLRLQNPFDLVVVLQFVALLIGVILATHWLGTQYGKPGVFALSAFSGLADVDPMTLSMAKSANHGVSALMAMQVILVTVGANMFAKCVLAFVFGRARLASVLLGAAVIAGGASATSLAFS